MWEVTEVEMKRFANGQRQTAYFTYYIHFPPGEMSHDANTATRTAIKATTCGNKPHAGINIRVVILKYYLLPRAT